MKFAEAAADTNLRPAAKQCRACHRPLLVHYNTFIKQRLSSGRTFKTFFFTAVLMEHHSRHIIPNRKQMIFVASWHIVPLIMQPYNVLDCLVQNRNFPSTTIVSSDARSDPWSDPWEDFVTLFRREQQPLPQAWADLFGPLRCGAVDDLVIVGQLGQSLDGRIATESGHSKYINGSAGLEHLHRLRALVDAVVVGVGTAVADNPQLTVRRVAGPHPVRVVIDPKGRLGADARLFADNGVRRVVIVAQGARYKAPRGVEIMALPAVDGHIEPAAILAALAGCGLRRILIEGGANTVSRFLVAGCLDRLHVTVAPIILGCGGPGLVLPSLERADDAQRMPMRVYRVGEDVLFDCDLSAQRVALGTAKQST